MTERGICSSKAPLTARVRAITRCGVGFFAHSFGYGLQNPPCPVFDLHYCPATEGISAAC